MQEEENENPEGGNTEKKVVAKEGEHQWEQHTPEFKPEVKPLDHYTVHTCEKCEETFNHYFNRASDMDLKVVMEENDISEECKK